MLHPGSTMLWMQGTTTKTTSTHAQRAHREKFSAPMALSKTTKTIVVPQVLLAEGGVVFLTHHAGREKHFATTAAHPSTAARMATLVEEAIVALLP